MRYRKTIPSVSFDYVWSFPLRYAYLLVYPYTLRRLKFRRNTFDILLLYSEIQLKFTSFLFYEELRGISPVGVSWGQKLSSTERAPERKTVTPPSSALIPPGEGSSPGSDWRWNCVLIVLLFLLFYDKGGPRTSLVSHVVSVSTVHHLHVDVFFICKENIRFIVKLQNWRRTQSDSPTSVLTTPLHWQIVSNVPLRKSQ